MKKIASLVGAGVFALVSTGAVFAHDVVVVNKGDARQVIATTATAESGEIKVEVEDNKHFGKIKLGGSMTTGNADSWSVTRAIANQFTTKVKSEEAKVKNKGDDVDQELTTLADAFSGEIKVEVEDNKHFGKIKLGGQKTTGAAYADSTTEAWANIFDTKVKKSDD